MADKTDKAHFTHGTVRQRLDLALHRELAEGETIAWQGMMIAKVDIKAFAIYLFAIPWTAIALLWTSLALRAAGDIGSSAGFISYAFPLFGVPFILIGLAMFTFPFLSFFQRGRVLFAVTDQRVLQLSLGRELTVNSVPGDRILDISRSESADGSGMVTCNLSVQVTTYGGGKSNRLKVGRVDDVHGAFSAIREIVSS